MQNHPRHYERSEAIQKKTKTGSLHCSRDDDLQKTLLAWYDIHKRAFPWRTTPAVPYFVFLSEIMLQQTTTKTVIPYFLKFIKHYPDFNTLKTASLDDIYLLWQGLGYYSRARNLHKASQMIDGYLPQTKEALLALPGIGDYTSSAICAIAFNQPYLPIDGNIRRVMARFYGLEEPCGPPLHKMILERVIIKKRAGDFCQALMDFANTICLPKNPKCDICPLNSKCSQKIHLPLKKEKVTKKKLYTQAFITIQNNQILLCQNQDLSLLKGLWNVPLTPFSNIPYLPLELSNHLGSVRHIFTHIDLHVDIYQSQKPYAQGEWFENLSSIALSTLAKKILKVTSHGE